MKSRQADVIVVGAGIIGSSIAWRLAQKGVTVQLRDAGRMGGQASSAGAGMLAPGGEVEGPSAFARLLIESLRLYPEFINELMESTGIIIDYAPCGAIESVENEEQWTALAARARVQALMGVRSEPCGSESLFYPDDAVVDPVHVLSALRVACSSCGVTIVEDSPVTNLDALQADAVVLAAGAWSSSIAGPLLGVPASFPVKGHLIGYDLSPQSLGPIRRRSHTYILQRRNGFTVAGSTTEHKGFDITVDPAVVEEVRGRAEALYPTLATVAPVRSWTGLRPGIDSAEPAIGRLAGTRLWLAYGHYRNGILAAPATAAQIAAGITSSLETASLVLPNSP
jgi:glycine oxidase